jgi:hypothetical protein
MIRLVFLRTRVEEFAKQAAKSAPNRPARVQFLTPFRLGLTGYREYENWIER